MSLKTKLAALALATVAVTGAMASTTTQAHAGPKWIGPAIVGAAIVGTAVAASAANDGYYYGSYRRCGWAPRYNAFGHYVGSVRVCNF